MCGKNLFVVFGLTMIARITPACAGKTDLSKIQVEQYQDHPRVCGKNMDLLNEDGEGVGSPPRVREKPYLL